MPFEKGSFTIYALGREFPNAYEKMIFSGGEIQIRLSKGFLAEIFLATSIKALLTSSEKIMELYMLQACLIQNGAPFMDLECPYLPYARQDRMMDSGEALLLKPFCAMLKSMSFERITVWDVHSDVSLALLNEYVHNIGPESFLSRLPIPISNCVAVAPDAGASKKVFKVAQGFKIPFVQAEKHRSVEDGSITGTTVHSEHIGDKDFLIVDDICDGGRTFIELAKKLRPLTNGKVYLYVTHGIFSQGLEVFRDVIDHVYCPSPFPNVDLSSDLITKMKVDYDASHN